MQSFPADLSEAQKAKLIEEQHEALRRIKSQALPYGVLIAKFPDVLDPVPQNNISEPSVTDTQQPSENTLSSVVREVENEGVGDGSDGIFRSMRPSERILEKRFEKMEASRHTKASRRVAPEKKSEAPAPAISQLRGRAVVLYAGKLIEVGLPDNLNLQPGDGVQLNPGTQQIVGKALVAMRGETVVIGRILNDGFCETGEEPVRIVFMGKFTGELKESDLVALDPSGSIVVEKLEPRKPPFSGEHQATRTWDDIVGQGEAVQKMRGAIEYPFTHQKLYAAYGGKGTVKGAMISGPPGNGKTMLAEATATGLQRLHGKEEMRGGYFYVGGSEFLESLVGLGEKRIDMLFDAGKRFYKKTGRPAVLVVDECEAILKKRGTGKSSDVNDSYVTAFLRNMDGVGDSHMIVILITNRPDILDPAIARDKRIDIKIVVGPPKAKDVPAYFKIHLCGVKLAKDTNEDAAATAATTELLSDQYSYFKGSIETGGPEVNFTLKELMSGAMIAGIVDEAVRIALYRDIAAGREEATGVSIDDLRAAVATKFEEQKNLDLSDYRRSFVEQYQKEVAGKEIQRQKSGE